MFDFIYDVFAIIKTIILAIVLPLLVSFGGGCLLAWSACFIFNAFGIPIIFTWKLACIVWLMIMSLKTVIGTSINLKINFK